MCFKKIFRKLTGQPDIFRGHDPSPEWMNDEMPTYTVKELIDHLEYRIIIHKGWLERIIKNPSLGVTYGDVNFQYWAMEGYENSIYYLKTLLDTEEEW